MADAGKNGEAAQRVLVIEDEPGHAKLIRKALCQTGGTMVTVAETASSALDALGVKLAGPEDIVHFAYGLFFCPTYRTRYAEMLRTGFPRLFIPPGVNRECQ